MSYATTPTLSCDAPQVRVRLFSVMFEQLGGPGLVGSSVSPGTPTLSASRFGPPAAVLAVARIVLLPAFSGALMVTVCQVDQAPVGGKASSSETSVPLTVMSIGRFTAEPLAYRKPRLTLPAAGAPTVNST